MLLTLLSTSILFTTATTTAAPARHPELPARAVGVLVMPGVHPWGTFYEPGFDWSWAGTEERTVHRFLIAPGDAEHEYAPYFQPKGDVGNAFQLHIELPRERTQYTVDMARGAIERNARAHGVDGAVNLVELDVNDRRGGHGPHFVVTGARVLDADLDDKLMAARRAFDVVVSKHQASLAHALDDAERKLRAQHDPQRILGDAGGGELVVYRPFWNAATESVDVFFGYRRTGGVRVKTSPRRDSHTKTTKEAPAPPVIVARYGVAMGARYRIAARGDVVEVELFAPMSLEGRRVPWEDQYGHVLDKSRSRPHDDDNFAGGGGAAKCEPSMCGPKPRLPTERCADGSVGGFTGRCVAKSGGRCGWEVNRCR